MWEGAVPHKLVKKLRKGGSNVRVAESPHSAMLINPPLLPQNLVKSREINTTCPTFSFSFYFFFLYSQRARQEGTEGIALWRVGSVTHCTE